MIRYVACGIRGQIMFVMVLQRLSHLCECRLGQRSPCYKQRWHCLLSHALLRTQPLCSQRLIFQLNIVLLESILSQMQRFREGLGHFHKYHRLYRLV